jgi:hypothetical protein
MNIYKIYLNLTLILSPLHHFYIAERVKMNQLSQIIILSMIDCFRLIKIKNVHHPLKN